MEALTQKRKDILEHIQGRHDHPTAKDIYTSLLDCEPKISLATVYNSLDFLSNNGYIKKYNFDEEYARYDGNLMPHSHMNCSDCGKIYDIRINPGADISSMIHIPSGFTVDGYSLQVSGICSDCKKN